MEESLCQRSATVSFGDGYAKWYKLWSEHNRYHDRIIETLTKMVKPGWKVLDAVQGLGFRKVAIQTEKGGKRGQQVNSIIKNRAGVSSPKV